MKKCKDNRGKITLGPRTRTGRTGRSVAVESGPLLKVAQEHALSFAYTSIT